MKIHREQHDSWQQIGRAAEQFARRVARDAADFATRVEEHVGVLASEIGREWRSAGCEAGSAAGAGAESTAGAKPESTGATADVRRIFEDVRGVLSAVLGGVDELITTAFTPSADEPWERVTANLAGVCAACARPIAVGAEAFARRRAGSHELRCAACGVPEGGGQAPG
jgi:hypothetical protein